MYDYLAKHMRDRNAIYRITDTEVRWTNNNMTPVRTMRFDRKCRIVKGYKTTVKYEFALIL